eukprot:12478615-Heterocapsa_arctica.AAC.1
MRPCYWCGGRHMDKDCKRFPTPPGRPGAAAAKAAPMPSRPKGKGKGKGKISGQIMGACHRCGKQGHKAADCRGVMAVE